MIRRPAYGYGEQSTAFSSSIYLSQVKFVFLVALNGLRCSLRAAAQRGRLRIAPCIITVLLFFAFGEA
jgi:hypothetical protein